MSQSPMLAERESAHLYPEEVRFPLYASPKLDGIRCVVESRVAKSRKFIPIPNHQIREFLSKSEFEGLDGELIVGPVAAENVFNRTTRAVMGNRVKDPEWSFHVFDDFTAPASPYEARQLHLKERLLHIDGYSQDPERRLRYVLPVRVTNWDELENQESAYLALGYEGVITRSPHDGYKFGRSTKNQQGMLKLKRFSDGEAEIIGFEELMHNTNENIKDAFGRAKRSTAAEGLVSGGTLGKLQVRDLVTGVEFQIGMFKGLTLADKQAIWDAQGEHMGKIVKYQHFSHGAVDLPRHSKFIGFRSALDM